MTAAPPTDKGKRHMPIVVVDTDAICDLTPWEPLAKAREWDQFFSHIPDAAPRDNMLLDLLELAKSDGCWVTYTSRWDSKHRQPVWEWLRANGFPTGTIYLRPYANVSPVNLAHEHVQRIAKKALGNRPVIVIHNDPNIAAALCAKGIAAIDAARVPQTVKGFRDLLTHARLVANTKPEKPDDLTAAPTPCKPCWTSPTQPTRSARLQIGSVTADRITPTRQERSTDVPTLIT